MENNYCFLNGEWMPFSEAKIHVNDLGVLRGFGIFDFLRTYNKVPFHVESHIRRLENSAQFLNLDIPVSFEEVIKMVQNLIDFQKKNPLELGIKLTLTGGFSLDGTTFEGKPNFFVTCQDMPQIPAHYYSEGIKVITYHYQRHLPEIKTTNYLPIYILQKEREQKQAQDLLYHDQNRISECPRANFFMFRGDQLLTPKYGTLKGITRQIVLDLAQDYFEVIETDFSLEDLLSEGSEAFKTGSAGELTPIVQVDEHLIADGKVGKNTRKLMRMFQKYAQDVSVKI